LISLSIEAKTQRARRTFHKLLDRVTDMRPVWKDFIQYWQDDLMHKTWDSKGAVMEAWDRDWETIYEMFF